MHHQRVRHLHVPRRERDAPLPHLRQPATVPRVHRRPTLTRAEDDRRPAVRRDADGGYRIGLTWESVTERLIREAQEAGSFDELPGRGRRLQLDVDPREGDMGLAFHILRTNHAVPPWIAADMEARRCAGAIERLLADAGRADLARPVTSVTRARFRARLARLCEEHDHAVEALDATAPSVTLQRRRADRAALLARLERGLDGTPHEGARP